MQRAALSGAIGLAVWPEPVTGFIGGALVSIGKTLFKNRLSAKPSRKCLAGRAKQRYQSALGLIDRSGLGEFELVAAREAAKQQYLRELAEALRE